MTKFFLFHLFTVCIIFTYIGERTELQVTISQSDTILFDHSITGMLYYIKYSIFLLNRCFWFLFFYFYLLSSAFFFYWRWYLICNIFYVILAHDPPPICLSPAFVQILADLCFDFYDIQVKLDKINVCFRIKPRILGKTVKNLEIGCFTLTPGNRLE